MSEGVSLIIWPTTAKYSLISLQFYVLCQKLRKHCNDISILKRAYLYNHWFKSYELNSIRKPRRSTVLSLCNAKWDFHTVKHHTATNPKLPNIATLSEPTVGVSLQLHFDISAFNLITDICYMALHCQRTIALFSYSSVCFRVPVIMVAWLAHCYFKISLVFQELLPGYWGIITKLLPDFFGNYCMIIAW